MMARLRYVLLYLLIITLAGCVSMSPVRTEAPQQLQTETPLPAATGTPTAAPPTPCRDSQFAIPQEILAAGKRISVYEHYDTNPWKSYPGGLSIHLEALAGAVASSDPIPFRIIVSNDSEQPLIFVIPQEVHLRSFHIIRPHAVIIKIISPLGEEIKTSYVDYNITPYFALPVEEFSMLPAGAHCSLDFNIRWEDTYADDPLLPGDYQMTLFLYLADRGPRLSRDSLDIADIGAWVGRTEESNAVSFTVLPPGAGQAAP